MQVGGEPLGWPVRRRHEELAATFGPVICHVTRNVRSERASQRARGLILCQRVVFLQKESPEYDSALALEVLAFFLRPLHSPL